MTSSFALSEITNSRSLKDWFKTDVMQAASKTPPSLVGSRTDNLIALFGPPESYDNQDGSQFRVWGTEIQASRNASRIGVKVRRARVAARNARTAIIRGAAMATLSNRGG